MIFLGSHSDLQGTEVVVESSPKPNGDVDDVIVVKDIIDENEIDIAEALLANKEHKDQLNIDVKIGDGMDIAIHGENGKYFMYSFKLGNFIQFVFGIPKHSPKLQITIYKCMNFGIMNA